MLDALPTPQLLQNLFLLTTQFRRNDHRDRLTDDFGWLITEDPHGRSVPGEDTALECLGDESIVGGVADRCQQREPHGLIGLQVAAVTHFPYRLGPTVRWDAREHPSAMGHRHHSVLILRIAHDYVRV